MFFRHCAYFFQFLTTQGFRKKSMLSVLRYSVCKHTNTWTIRSQIICAHVDDDDDDDLVFL